MNTWKNNDLGYRKRVLIEQSIERGISAELSTASGRGGGSSRKRTCRRWRNELRSCSLARRFVVIFGPPCRNFTSFAPINFTCESHEQGRPSGSATGPSHFADVYPTVRALSRLPHAPRINSRNRNETKGLFIIEDRVSRNIEGTTMTNFIHPMALAVAARFFTQPR